MASSRAVAPTLLYLAGITPAVRFLLPECAEPQGFNLSGVGFFPFGILLVLSRPLGAGKGLSFYVVRPTGAFPLDLASRLPDLRPSVGPSRPLQSVLR